MTLRHENKKCVTLNDTYLDQSSLKTQPTLELVSFSERGELFYEAEAKRNSITGHYLNEW